MKLLSKILGEFIGVGAIALIIVFQQELRRFLLLIGTRGFYRRNYLFRILLPFYRKKPGISRINMAPIIQAITNMSASKTGAIIVITRKSELKFYMNTGVMIKSKLSAPMIETIFFKNNPLHDGAIIISNDTIMVARTVLPVTENITFPSHLGMRHRAAVGISEQSDAVAIVVSEQTGKIAYTADGKIEIGLSPAEIEEMLKEDFR